MRLEVVRLELAEVGTQQIGDEEQQGARRDQPA
jgi:hypothetical protein